jgi:endonuclease/exonuclease/phosphatase family metal-dependent hydrolase
MLRVVSYNVHGLRDDRSALASVVRSLEPDVLIVQEAPRRFRWRTRNAHLAHDLGLVYVAGGAPSLGNVILTSLRVTVAETWELRYPLTPGRHMRGAVFARCTVGGAPFVVVGSHLSLDGSERPAQARLLAKALADVDVPVILGADFNEPPGGAAWQALGAELSEAAHRVRAGGSWATFPAVAPRQRIDAVLVSPGIEVTGYRVAGDLDGVGRASDHLPVVAELALP